MANIPVKREDWEALSEGNRQAIEDALRKAGALGEGDKIGPMADLQFAAIDPACFQECDDMYENAVQFCNALGEPDARAICFAAAATAYGGCLAVCWTTS